MPQRIAVERWGNAGPALLCLHGLGGSTAFFEALGPALSHRARVVAFDFPGSGRSATPRDISFEALASAAVDVAREIDPPLYLLGHSMGTIVALEAVRLAPALASGFLAVGGLRQARADASERIAARIALIEERGMAGLGGSVAAANVSARTRAERPGVVARVSSIFEAQPQGGYLATARALVAWKARPLPALDAVRCLAITGTEDRYAPPEDVRMFAADLPGSPDAVIVPGCGHLPFLEDPHAFGQIVDRFLAGP